MFKLLFSGKRKSGEETLYMFAPGENPNIRVYFGRAAYSKSSKNQRLYSYRTLGGNFDNLNSYDSIIARAEKCQEFCKKVIMHE